MKFKTIKLKHFHRWAAGDPEPIALYKVEVITDSVEYYPGQELIQKTVEDLCKHEGWKVTVT